MSYFRIAASSIVPSPPNPPSMTTEEEEAMTHCVSHRLCVNVGTDHSWRTRRPGWITHHFDVVLFHYR
jgi:hypothetical protein